MKKTKECCPQDTSETDHLIMIYCGTNIKLYRIYISQNPDKKQFIDDYIKKHENLVLEWCKFWGVQPTIDLINGGVE
jgi:hypothetical protein